MSSDDVTEEEEGRTNIAIPSPPVSTTSARIDGILAYLDKLEQQDTQAAQAQGQLTERRSRRDARLARKRAMEDQEYRAVLAARKRQDRRIAEKRQSEDAVYSRFYRECDQLEYVCNVCPISESDTDMNRTSDDD